jgi:hypothetical protein
MVISFHFKSDTDRQRGDAERGEGRTKRKRGAENLYLLFNEMV